MDHIPESRYALFTPSEVLGRRMAHQHVTRRLATIPAADMVGYSRLMGEDDLTDAEWALIVPHRPARSFEVG